MIFIWAEISNPSGIPQPRKVFPLCSRGFTYPVEPILEQLYNDEAIVSSIRTLSLSSVADSQADSISCLQ